MSVYTLEEKSASYIPNTYQKPNFIVDKLAWLLTPEEYMVLDYIVRHILGWRNRIASRQASISLKMFTDGFTITRKDGTQDHYYGLNLCRDTVNRCLKALVAFGIIEKGDETPQGTAWTLPETPAIQWDALVERKQQKKGQGRSKVKNARERLLELKNPVCTTDYPQSVPQTTPSLYHRQNQTQETHIETQDSSATEVTDIVPVPVVKEKKEKQPDYLARSWLYVADPVPDDQFATLGKPDQRTAIFSVICWKAYRTVTAPEEVYKKLTAKKRGKALGLEHRLNSILSEIEGLTPSLCAQVFDSYHQANPFAKDARDPAIFVNEIEKHLVSLKPVPVSSNPKEWTPERHPDAEALRLREDWKWVHDAYIAVANLPEDKHWRALVINVAAIWTAVYNAFQMGNPNVAPWRGHIESYLAKRGQTA